MGLRIELGSVYWIFTVGHYQKIPVRYKYFGVHREIEKPGMQKFQAKILKYTNGFTMK
jgi:hypothetical protein